MNRTVKNIATLVLSFALATPSALRANEPAANPVAEVDEISNTQNDNFENSTTTFLTLDEDALEELAQFAEDENNDELAAQILDFASKHLGRPYRHGAKGPSAFDCSGFTSYVFKNHGINLSPSSKMQYTQGVKIDKNDVQPGDLLFFSGRKGGNTVGHVAIAVDVDDNGTIKFIHASSSKGISYNRYPDGGYYSKRFIGARRVIE